MQDYFYDYSDSALDLFTSPTYTPIIDNATGPSAAAALVLSSFVILLVLFSVAWGILVIIARWKIFKKAGEEGWKSMVPIYSDYTMFKILSMEPLLCIISSIPVSHLVLNIVMKVKLAKSFNKGTGYAVGLILLAPVFEMMLGFGSAQYKKLPSSK